VQESKGRAKWMRKPVGNEPKWTVRVWFAVAVALLATTAPVLAQSNDECQISHDEVEIAASVHGELDCVMCHQELDGVELPHEQLPGPVDCGFCHATQATEHANSLHGRAAARGDKLAPGCTDCHGTHDILSHTDSASPTAIMSIPLLCGRCHHEGTEVSLTHDIPQERILENYSLSIHG